MVKIRKATIKDLDEIAELLHEYDLYEHKLNKNHKIEKISEIISFNKKLMENKKTAFYVIDNGDWILGIVSGEWRKTAKAKEAMFHNIIISKNERGKGYGKKLLNALEKHFKNIGCKQIKSFVLGTNKKATGFYKKLNYSVDPGFWIEKKLK